MKLAIICTGHPRTYKRCLNNWKQAICDRFDADYFFGLWSINGTKLDNFPDTARKGINCTQPTPIINTDLILQNEVKSDLSKFAKKKNILFFDPTEHNLIILKYIEENAPNILKIKSYHQNAIWMGLPTTLWHQSYLMTLTYEKLVKKIQGRYDVLIRTRPDAAWVGLPHFTKKYSKICALSYDRTMPHDFLMWSSPKLMETIFNIYNLLPSINLELEKTQNISAIDSHMVFKWVSDNMVPYDLLDTNHMSLVRNHSYPTKYDTSFLLKEKYAAAWRNPKVNVGEGYDGESTLQPTPYPFS